MYYCRHTMKICFTLQFTRLTTLSLTYSSHAAEWSWCITCTIYRLKRGSTKHSSALAIIYIHQIIPCHNDTRSLLASHLITLEIIRHSHIHTCSFTNAFSHPLAHSLICMLQHL